MEKTVIWVGRRPAQSIFPIANASTLYVDFQVWVHKQKSVTKTCGFTILILEDKVWVTPVGKIKVELCDHIICKHFYLVSLIRKLMYFRLT